MCVYMADYIFSCLYKYFRKGSQPSTVESSRVNGLCIYSNYLKYHKKSLSLSFFIIRLCVLYILPNFLLRSYLFKNLSIETNTRMEIILFRMARVVFINHSCLLQICVSCFSLLYYFIVVIVVTTLYFLSHTHTLDSLIFIHMVSK